MRAALVWVSVLVFPCGCAYAAATIADWQERPFFARRPGQQVPPPQFYTTTAVIPAGAEVRIKVVKCPAKARLDLHDFVGGPVFSRGVLKEFTDLAAGQVLTYKLAKKTKIGITAKAGEDAGICRGRERQDGYDVLQYSCGSLGELTIKVEVVGP